MIRLSNAKRGRPSLARNVQSTAQSVFGINWKFQAAAFWTARLFSATPVALLIHLVHRQPRLKGSPRAFTKGSGEATGPRMANQARSAAAAVFQSGNARSRRPLPRTRMLADWAAVSSRRRPVSSETRRPAHTARCNIARSRTPFRVDGSGASSRACISSWTR
jgi:hypothetical protein